MKIEETNISRVAGIIALPIRAWLAVICIGALGHRMHIPYLLHIGFFDVLLLILALGFVRSNSATSWSIKNEETSK